jgi:succinate dehydrogenase hydrophobic anchor subunit
MELIAMKVGDWIFLALSGLCMVPLQAAVIYTLVKTFRKPVGEARNSEGYNWSS